MKNILVIQTAFIGDVILATPLIVALRRQYPDSEISFLVRKGNETLLQHDPEIKEILVWDKTKTKYSNLVKMTRIVRSRKFDTVINLQRFAASGLVTFNSGAKRKIGFNKNPFAFAYTTSKPHSIGDGTHEIQRNLSLISENPEIIRPRIVPGTEAENTVDSYCQKSFVCIAPASVWHTKQYPQSGWVDLCNNIPADSTVYLIGSPDDITLCEKIAEESRHKNIEVLAGRLSLLESAALMARAEMNYVNDSAPLHLASAMNAPVRAVFCSTVPKFGFGPVSDNSRVIEIKEDLYCRPCGLHGYKRCPENHFDCAKKIKTEQFFEE